MHGLGRDLVVILLAIFAMSACRGQATPASRTSVPPEFASTPGLELTLAPTQISQPIRTEPTAQLPLTEAKVPRVTVQDAKAAFDRGEAIFVDVHEVDAYRVSHLAGAVHIALGEFETNPTALPLDKDQWIITYENIIH